MSISQPTQVLLAAYAQKGQDALIVAPSTLQLALYSARAFNRSGGTSDVGIVQKFAAAGFSVFTYQATTAYTAISIPSAATTIIATTTGNGFAIQSKKKSGLIGFNVTQASATGTFVYKYWNGTTWASLTTIEVPDYSSTGVKVIVFLPPSDWVAGGDGILDTTKYSVRVNQSAGTATAIKVDSMWAGQLIEFYESVADNSSVQIEFDTNRPLVLDASEGIMPYFATASAGNGMQISYSTL